MQEKIEAVPDSSGKFIITAAQDGDTWYFANGAWSFLKIDALLFNSEDEARRMLDLYLARYRKDEV